MKARLIIVLSTLLFVGGAFAADEGVSWNELSADQQAVLGHFSDTWDSLPANRQQRLATGAARWSAMTPEQRQRLRDHLRERPPKRPRDRK